MGRVYAVASAKGGVGKTTLTANLGVTLAAAGLDVAVVDADMSMPNLGRLVGVSPDGPTLHDVLAGDADPLDAVYEGPEGVAVVPGETTLDAYATVDPRGLRHVVSALADVADVVLLDTGAGLSHDTVLPLGLADTVLLVSTPSPDALGDTEKTRQVAERLDVPVVGLALTRVDTERVDVDAIRARVEPPVVGVIPEDPLDADSTGGLAVTRDADAAVAAAYRALAASVVPDDAKLTFDAPAASDVAGRGEDATPGDEPDAAPAEAAVDDADAASTGDEDSTDAASTGDEDSTDVAVDLSSALDDTSRDPVDDFDDAFDLDTAGEREAADTEPTDSTEAGETGTTGPTDEHDSGGLASMLADAESSAGTSDPATDVVVEAEPGREPDDSSETDDTDVTTEPTGTADIPDAEAPQTGTGADTPDPDERGSTDRDGADADESDDSDAAEETDDSAETDESSGGLFSRFFG